MGSAWQRQASAWRAHGRGCMALAAHKAAATCPMPPPSHPGRRRPQVNSLREIQALRRLSPHGHIIKLLEVLFDQPTGRLALVFELMVRERRRTLHVGVGGTGARACGEQRMAGSADAAAASVARPCLPVAGHEHLRAGGSGVQPHTPNVPTRCSRLPSLHH